jgi:transposase
MSRSWSGSPRLTWPRPPGWWPRECRVIRGRESASRRYWEVPAITNAIIELGEHLAGLGIEKVTLESTSDYWRPFCYLLEAAGLDVQLVRAQDVKQAPGRPKSDKLDAVWLAKLTERGMLRPSFVPPAEIRQLRDYTRLRVDLTRDRSRQAQRLEKLLEDALIKLSTVATDIMGVSGRAMIEALIAGERDPQVLAGLARGRMKVKHAALVQALTGRFDGHHGELARVLLGQYDALTAEIGRLTSRIEELIAAIPEARGVGAGGATGPSVAGRRPTAPGPQGESGQRAGSADLVGALISWVRCSRGARKCTFQLAVPLSSGRPDSHML